MKTPTPRLKTTGIVYSDYRLAGGVPKNEEADGWVKGWLVNTPKRNIVITATHCGASSSPPTNLVRAYNTNGVTVTRKIVEVVSPNYVKVEPNLRDVDNDGDGRGEGDLTIARIDKPFPQWAKGYNFANNVKEGQQFTLHTRDQGIIKGRCHANKQVAWISGYEQSAELIHGISGLPWFVLEDGEWRVATHSTRGGWLGGGIWYMHPKLRNDILQKIEELSNR